MRQQFSRRNCLTAFGVLVLLLVMLVVGGAFVINRFVNIGAIVSDGGEAAVQVPAGFSVNIFASGLLGPRFMAVGPDGHLYVADRLNDRIIILPDRDGDGVADETLVFATGLNRPHSLTYHEGSWYVGVPAGIVVLTDSDGDLSADSSTMLIDDFPTSCTHITRTVDFLPDGRMVVSIGSSCNVCEEADERRAAIVVYDMPGALNERLYATGLRNAVGLAVQPGTGHLWASNNGRDLMGDDLPPETVYRLSEGSFYGWPVCHNGYLIDPDMGSPGSCDGVTPPTVEMQAHSAPLGLAFYDAQQFPEEYWGDLFIAFHGSWNRSEPTGYKVVRLDLVSGVPATAVEDFATGWLDGATGEAAGRPVDVVVGADGALYVSDDKGHFIYRISYTGE